MKKKILYLILVAFAMFAGTNACFARLVEVDADGNSIVLGGSTLTEQEQCMYGGYNGLSLNAVRLTVVDANGNRVAGTRSVDFTSGGSGSGNKLRSTDVKTRNEIISGGMSYGYGSDTVPLNPWSNLPGFNCTGSSCGGIMLKNYFLTKYASTDTADLIRNFTMMGYEGYKNPLMYENHYLLVEPIFQTQIMTPVYVHEVTGGKIYYEESYYKKKKEEKTAEYERMYGKSNYDSGVKTMLASLFHKKNDGAGIPELTCGKTYTTYYGTATEILYMMENEPEALKSYNYKYGNSYGTIVSNIAGLVHDDTTVAGLLDASGIVGNKNSVRNNLISQYGLGTMHVWMKYIMEGCPNGVCPNFCPDGVTPIPDGQTAEAVCPPTYCPDMKTVIPPGKTASEVCPPSACNYSLKTSITNDCKDGQEGYIKDIGTNGDDSTNLDEWKCIFDTANSPMNTYEGEFYHPNGSTFFDDNPYCRVACRETIKYHLPSTFEEVAGRRFTIGSSNEFVTGVTPNTIEGTTTCSTAYAPGTQTPVINYELFKQNYATANIDVVNKWNAYQTAIAKEKAFQAASQVSSSEHDEACTGPKIDDTNSCPGGWSGQLVNSAGTPTSQEACDACSAIAKAFGTADCGCHNERSCPGGYGKKVDTAHCNEWEHGSPKYTEYKWSGSFNNGVYSATVEYITTSCGGHGQNKDAVWGAIQAEKNAAKAAYEEALRKRSALLVWINKCNNFQRTYTEFEPELSFAYSETKYKGSHKLAATPQTHSITNYLVNNQSVDVKPWTSVGYQGNPDTFIADVLNSYGSTDYIDRTDCNNELQPCINNVRAQIFPNNTSVIQTTRKTYEYELPGNSNRYVAKNGKSYDTAYDAELSDYPYIDTGRSNLPINFETPGGWYHYYYDFYYANGTANLFGTNQKFLKYNKVEPGGTSTYNGLTLADNLLYHCIYKVDCGLLPCDSSNTCPDGSEMPPDGKCPDYTIEHKTCPSGVPMPISGICPDNKGINIIYRTISLNDPFPGEHGDGRAAGANWNGEATVLGTRMSFIDAYITNNRGVSTEKVYQETPMYQFTLTPANIRKIRKYNRSTGNDYNDYNFECSNGKYCKSEFLEEGIGNGYFGFSSKNPNGGSCFNAYSTDWESCRYSSIGG